MNNSPHPQKRLNEAVASAAHEDGSDGEAQCLVCLESFSKTRAPSGDRVVFLTCCQKVPQSNNVLCSDCCLLLVRSGSMPDVGRCPMCRAFFRIHNSDRNGLTIDVLRDVGQCPCCMQMRVVLPSGRCDACTLGSRFVLLYECERCGVHQRIPHPMWRYQPTPASFGTGTSTWACRQCATFTHWRVHPDCAAMVPVDDTPPTWGMREAWLASLRAAPQREHHRSRSRGSILISAIIAVATGVILLQQAVMVVEQFTAKWRILMSHFD